MMYFHYNDYFIFMNLLTNQTATGHIAQAINHFNYAQELKDRTSSKVEVARSMFDGLNKLQTEWFMYQPEPRIGEIKAFQAMILQGLKSAVRNDFLRSKQIQNLVLLDPKIMDHSILGRKGYIPNMSINPSLVIDATRVHRKFESAYRDYIRENDNEAQERIIKRVAELLYIVRSNIAHGEKTPYGPDLAKIQRDEQVCIAVVPLQEMIYDALLDRPSEKLISYGTLAPGQSNYQLIADMRGDWIECFIIGAIRLDQGLSKFTPNNSGIEQTASLLKSKDLPMNWERIDRFEGDRYRRRLVHAETQTGLTIAYTYTSS